MKNKQLALSIKAAILVLAAALIFSAQLSCLPVYAASNSTKTAATQAKAATTITGYKTDICAARSKAVTISAVISPAQDGRLVKLQRYSTTEKKWITVDRYYVQGSPSASVSFTVPGEERMKTTGTWRIRVHKTDTAEAASSRNITITSKNIKSYKLSAKAACIYRIDGDGEGTLIYDKNAGAKRAQASTTKLMTAVLLLESGLLETKTTISRHAASTPWGSGRLSKGDIYRTHDLLYAMMLPSANDAATAIAEKVGGTEKKFVKKMNKKAEDMGLKNTHFCNPHGLDADSHYTTAKELAMLTAYAYNFPEIRECWATKVKTIKNLKTNKKWTLWSTNSIFGYVSNFLGGKTGTEDNAGCCFTGVYQYKGSIYVTVVLGSGYGFSRWADTKKLHKYITKYAATKY